MSPLAIVRRKSAGFTLVELLVVIAIIGILVALLLPAIQSAREAARRSECKNNLKQIGLAIHMHHDTTGRFPSGRNGTNQFSVSWAYYLLPYIEEEAMYDAYVPTARVDDDLNALTMRTPIDVYACPSRRSPAADRNFDNNGAVPLVLGAASLGDYAANVGLSTDIEIDDDELVLAPEYKVQMGPIFTRSMVSDRHVIDGMSRSIAVGERHIPPEDPTVDPLLIHSEQGDTAFLAGDSPDTVFAEADLARGWDDESEDEFGGPHSGVTQFVFLDGRVETINNDIDEDAFEAMCTVAGGEIVD